MDNEKDNILKASVCTFHWLCYLSKATDKDKLIAECAIKYPFVESLERRSVPNVTLELKHPIYKGRNVDLYIGAHTDKNEFDEKAEAKAVFVEFKFLRGSSNVEDVFIDLLRLRSIKKKYQKSSCYLIVYGERLIFNTLLKKNSRGNDSDTEVQNDVKKKLVKNGVLSKWLSEGREECTIDMDMNDEKSYLDNFCREYQRRDGAATEIDKLSTKRVKLYNEWNEDTARFSFGVWEVL